MDMGMLYLRTSVLKEAFGFSFDFNFRALSADFQCDFTLPVLKLKQQEKLRQRIGGKGQEMASDTILPRSYHWFRGGMMDWSVTGVQSDNYTDETRLEWAGGTELLGGEANVFLDWSNKYGMTRRQQQYYWKWVDNHQTWLRQAQVGRIESRSITSLLAPIDGVSLSNASTTVRKALGEYVIADRTEPNWVVELYINGTLIAFTTADASGFYRFTVPIVYGTTEITLRFYGPKGEMRSAQKRFQTPYNMLPVGEFEYNITGGVVMDTLHSVFSRAEVSYGISRWLSMVPASNTFLR
jgi:hypothetical protein